MIYFKYWVILILSQPGRRNTATFTSGCLFRNGLFTPPRVLQGAHRRWAHQRRRPATEKNADQTSPSGYRCEIIKLPVQCCCPAIMIDVLADMAIEVAIRTFGEAEWPVDIE